MKLFSYKHRPFHLGPYPLERLARSGCVPDLDAVPPMQALRFHREDDGSLVNAMRRYQAMLDAIRDGLVKKDRATIPDDLAERSRHLKSFGYYQDASQAGVCRIERGMWLHQPIANPDVSELAELLRTQQTKTLAAGIDVIMAELKESMSAAPTRADHHTHAIVYLYEYPRDPGEGEPGCDWLQNSQAERASVRASETAAILSNYIRLLGYEARGHSATCSDIDLNRLAVAAGLAQVAEGPEGPVLTNPYTGTRFGLCAITTTLELEPDQPLAANTGFAQRWRSHGPAWWLGRGFAKNRFNQTAYRQRRFVDGAYPFERSRRVEQPTTLIDEPRIPRVPKRTDMFARAIFGDMGKQVQDGARNGNYVRKSATSFAARRPLGAFVLLQDGPVAPAVSRQALDAKRNADNIKAALYFLGADAVGISRCPEWAYYSHDAVGEPLPAYHPNAISVIIDQGHETMEGASGDDWIACSQSMRAYLRFSLLGGIIGDQIRNLGYGARVHTVMDGEVLQPPLLLLSGLGEVSRIGEVILNPYLGPRLKSGVITTDMPLLHDRPIDFGLQKFCEQCNKCARECPSGAITAGPKRMFNGYEIWKSDSQKCTTYRITQAAGAMCGRCMKTCPWNLEGLFAEAPFRWLATHVPAAAKHLARLDDRLGHGSINPVKQWWWNLEMADEGAYRPSAHGAEQRQLQPGLELKYEDQTLAVYPANLAPPPYPFPFPMDREAGIQAYEKLIGPEEYQRRLEAGEVENLAHRYSPPQGEAPVLRLELARVEAMTADISKYEFRSADGGPLPPFEAGAHLDVVVAPEFLRQYSLSGDPADRSRYQIAVLREDGGRGGSRLLHQIFNAGRKVFVSRPINHFPLVETADKTLLMGGGIGITPMLAMAHRLHAIGADFELHYSCKRRDSAGFLQDLATAPWAHRVLLHVSAEGTRADLATLLTGYKDGHHCYTCGPDRYMSSVLDTAGQLGWPEEALHYEYFSVPETPDYENHDFVLSLARSGRRVPVPADQSAADALIAAGIPVDLKCSDGLCGVCKCELLEGEVEHRDHVLSKAQREHAIILCQSRAASPGGEVVIDL
jgi:reductive dehalogenase